MAQVNLPPKIRCDNCGKTEEMTHPHEKWIRPRTWSGVKCDSVSGDEYPNNITMTDLCPQCGAAVHAAIKDALAMARADQPYSRGALIMQYLALRDQRLLASDGPARDTLEGCEKALRDVYLIASGKAPESEA